MITVTTEVRKQFQFEAAHRLYENYKGKCANLHGHNYVVEVVVRLREGQQLDATGFVIDFARFEPLQRWVEANWDHAVLLCERDGDLVQFCRTQGLRYYLLPANPSAEIMCHELLKVASEHLDDNRCYVAEVSISESPTSTARVTRTVSGSG